MLVSQDIMMYIIIIIFNFSAPYPALCLENTSPIMDVGRLACGHTGPQHGDSMHMGELVTQKSQGGRWRIHPGGSDSSFV